MTGVTRQTARRYWREWAAALLFLTALAVGLSIYFSDRSSYRRTLTITGGSPKGVRSQIAHRLAVEARRQGLELHVVGTEGSRDALAMVDRGTLDLALVQGGIERTGHPHVRQVAPLHIEPLHLFVKREIHRALEENLCNLRGKTVNLSTLGSGTHDLAQDVLRFSGLTTRRPDGSEDFVVSTASYEEL